MLTSTGQPSAETIQDDLTNIPGFLFIDHVAIAVNQGELEGQILAYKKLGFREIHQETVLGKDQVKESLLQIGDSTNLIQLLEPMNEHSPVQKWLDRNEGKGGMHHIGFRVSDAQVAFNYLLSENFKIIDEAPRPGSRGTTVFFIHPKSTPVNPFGVLIEVVEDELGGTPPE